MCRIGLACAAICSLQVSFSDSDTFLLLGIWIEKAYKQLYDINMKIPLTDLSIDVAVLLPDHISYFKEAGGAGLGGSVGCAVRLETRRSWVQPPPRSATFFHGDWSWNIFYGHSLPSADSRRTVVSFWRKNVHNTG